MLTVTKCKRGPVRRPRPVVKLHHNHTHKEATQEFTPMRSVSKNQVHNLRISYLKAGDVSKAQFCYNAYKMMQDGRDIEALSYLRRKGIEFQSTPGMVRWPSRPTDQSPKVKPRVTWNKVGDPD